MGNAVSIKLTTIDMTDHLGFGKDKRREGNLDILEGKVTFRLIFSPFRNERYRLKPV